MCDKDPPGGGFDGWIERESFPANAPRHLREMASQAHEGLTASGYTIVWTERGREKTFRVPGESDEAAKQHFFAWRRDHADLPRSAKPLLVRPDGTRVRLT